MTEHHPPAALENPRSRLHVRKAKREIVRGVPATDRVLRRRGGRLQGRFRGVFRNVVLQVLSIEDQQLAPAQSIEAHTPQFKEALRAMAIRYNINIVGGSHPTQMPKGRIENVACIFLCDGPVHEQPKIHPTPNQAR